MFDSPAASLMIMLLLCFMGMLVMFLFVVRSLTEQTKTLREGFMRGQKTQHALEQCLTDMNVALRALQGRAEHTGEHAAPVERTSAFSDMTESFADEANFSALEFSTGERAVQPPFEAGRTQPLSLS